MVTLAVINLEHGLLSLRRPLRLKIGFIVSRKNCRGRILPIRPPMYRAILANILRRRAGSGEKTALPPTPVVDFRYESTGAVGCLQDSRKMITRRTQRCRSSAGVFRRNPSEAQGAGTCTQSWRRRRSLDTTGTGTRPVQICRLLGLVGSPGF